MDYMAERFSQKEWCARREELRKRIEALTPEQRSQRMVALVRNVVETVQEISVFVRMAIDAGNEEFERRCGKSWVSLMLRIYDGTLNPNVMVKFENGLDLRSKVALLTLDEQSRLIDDTFVEMAEIDAQGNVQTRKVDLLEATKDEIKQVFWTRDHLASIQEQANWLLTQRELGARKPKHLPRMKLKGKIFEIQDKGMLQAEDILDMTSRLLRAMSDKEAADFVRRLSVLRGLEQ